MENLMQSIKNICETGFTFWQKAKCKALNMFKLNKNVKYIVGGSSLKNGLVYPNIHKVIDSNLHYTRSNHSHEHGGEYTSSKCRKIKIRCDDLQFTSTNFIDTDISSIFLRIRYQDCYFDNLIMGYQNELRALAAPETHNCKLRNVILCNYLNYYSYPVNSNIIHTAKEYGARGSRLAHFRSGDQIIITTGCFYGTIDEFNEKVLSKIGYYATTNNDRVKLYKSYRNLIKTLITAYVNRFDAMKDYSLLLMDLMDEDPMIDGEEYQKVFDHNQVF